MNCQPLLNKHKSIIFSKLVTANFQNLIAQTRLSNRRSHLLLRHQRESYGWHYYLFLTLDLLGKAQEKEHLCKDTQGNTVRIY